MKKYVVFLIIILLFTSCKNTKYTVSFYDGEKLLTSAEVSKGTVLGDISAPSKEGYIFVSWLKDGREYSLSNPITENMNLVANWVLAPDLPNNHKVTFDFGDYKKTRTIKDGETVSKPEVSLIKEKYKFVGWYCGEEEYDFSKPVTEDIVISAKFVRTRITVTYDLNGGHGKIVKTDINVGTVPKKPDNPSRFGYNFLYWTIGDKEYNFDTPLSDDTTIKANYKAKVYLNVTFDSDGGNIMSSEIVEEGFSLTKLPVPSKVGYTFKYWALDGVEFNVNTKITKDITLIAVYEENTSG